MTRIIAWFAAAVGVGLLSNASVRAASENGAAGVRAAFCHRQLFTISLKEVPEEAAKSIVAHKGPLNRIYMSDSCPAFISVLDAIECDAPNVLCEKVQIESEFDDCPPALSSDDRSEEHTSELQSQSNLV